MRVVSRETLQTHSSIVGPKREIRRPPRVPSSEDHFALWTALNDANSAKLGQIVSRETIGLGIIKLGQYWRPRLPQHAQIVSRETYCTCNVQSVRIFLPGGFLGKNHRNSESKRWSWEDNHGDKSFGLSRSFRTTNTNH